MNNSRSSTMTRTQEWGWGILIVVCALLALNGAALYFISADPATFEQDTGVQFEAVRQAFPTLVDHFIREGQSISILLAAFGLFALIVAFEGYRHGSRWAWNAMWVLVGLMVFYTIKFLFLDSRPDIGGFYLVLAVLTLTGQLLARSGPAQAVDSSQAILRPDR